MDCVGGCEDPRGRRASPTKEEVDYWTDRVENLVSTARGREKFRKYLEEVDLDLGLDHLEFYTKVRVFLDRLEARKPFPANTRPTMEERLELKDLFDLADDKVNLSSAELHRLRGVMNPSTPLHKSASLLAAAAARVLVLLHHEYLLYQRHLLGIVT